MRLPRLLAVLPILAMLPLASAQTTTATSASAPAGGTDYSTPNATTVAFYTALRAADVTAMKAAVLPDKDVEPVLTPLFELSAASARFQAAMEKRFTAAELARSKISDFVAPATILKDARDAKVNIEGDTATITLRTSTSDHPFQTITLKHVGDKWKIDAVKTMRLNSGQIEDVKKLLPTIEGSMRVVNEVRQDLEAGKFASPAAAQRMLQEKLTLVAKAAREVTTTTSQPR